MALRNGPIMPVTDLLFIGHSWALIPYLHEFAFYDEQYLRILDVISSNVVQKYNGFNGVGIKIMRALVLFPGDVDL